MRWILIIGFILHLSYSYAQNETIDFKSNGNLDVKPKPAQVQVNLNHQKLIKNQAATDVEVAGITIDKRAAKYYYDGELQNVTLAKAKKINLIYLNSFEFSEENSIVSETCKIKFQSEKDLGSYNYLRKFNERVEVAVQFEGCAFKIFLFSWKEIDDMINQ